MSRHKFQFSNLAAQQAEAALNAKEARALCERVVPEHLRESEPAVTTTAAGACFRRVSAILAGKEKSK